MSGDKQLQSARPDRIPLPPVLLTTVPMLTVPLAVVVGSSIFRPSPLVLFVSAIVGLIGPVVWIARRTRG